MTTHSFDSSYAKTYDFTYQNKNYGEEVKFILDLFSRHVELGQPTHVLDIGCGTGKHLSGFPESVLKCGVDRSAAMIAEARTKSISNCLFFENDIAEFRIPNRFDLVYSLFHVLSYQTTATAVKEMLRAIAHHLTDDGLAILDFWHRPAWECDPPKTRLMVRDTKEFSVVRVSSPSVDLVQSIATIDIRTFSKKSTTDNFTLSREIHQMRAFTTLELELLCESQDLRIVDSGPWMSSDRGLHADDWYGWIALRHRERSLTASTLK